MSARLFVFLLAAGIAGTLALTIADENGAFRRVQPWHRWLPWLWYPSVITFSTGAAWLLARDTDYSPVFRTILSLSWIVGALGWRFPRRAQPGPRSRLPVVVQALILGLVFGSALEFAVTGQQSEGRAMPALILALSQAFAFYQDIARWAYDRWLGRGKTAEAVRPTVE